MTGVIVIVSLIVFANNARFGGVIKLENFAYDVALSIRQAQLYGISVARFGTNFSAGYGLRLDLANPTTYLMFADVITANGLYDGCPAPGTSNCELVQTSSMSGGYLINDICVTPSSGVEVCKPAAPTVLDVFFVRPEPDALISAGGASCILSGSNCQIAARIQLKSPRGETMYVAVEASGQISVERVSK